MEECEQQDEDEGAEEGIEEGRDAEGGRDRGVRGRERGNGREGPVCGAYIASKDTDFFLDGRAGEFRNASVHPV